MTGYFTSELSITVVHWRSRDNTLTNCISLYFLACVVGFHKGRGTEKELGHETMCEGGGRRGTPARKPLFLPSRLLIKKITEITQL